VVGRRLSICNVESVSRLSNVAAANRFCHNGDSVHAPELRR
jgi:hypothetical protein